MIYSANSQAFMTTARHGQNYECRIDRILLVYMSFSTVYSVVDIVFRVCNVPFNNISVISWWSVLLVEETGVPRENHRPDASH
jgi:hypothetical protein